MHCWHPGSKPLEDYGAAANGLLKCRPETEDPSGVRGGLPEARKETWRQGSYFVQN